MGRHGVALFCKIWYNIFVESKLIKAVMFDLDGTIIDTEKYYRLYWPKAFAKFGYAMTDELALGMRSLGYPFVEEYVKKISVNKADLTEIKKYARSLVDESVKANGLELKDGVEDCLKFLKTKNVTIAIVTATAADRTKTYIKEANIEKYFDDIISAKNVPHGKPAPDVYLTACEKLNVKPDETIAVEDSPNGVMSANRAGCNVVMVPDQTEADDELMKHLFGNIKSLRDFEDFVSEQRIIFKK
jgi:DNA helicase-2/ATP-dependent DNA helicase PcrA